MVINHNISAYTTHRIQKFNNDYNDKIYNHLSSAIKIARSGDDASGLAVSEKMITQIRGLNRAAQNTQDGISLIQAADGYLQDSTDLVQRLRELAVAASNGIYSKDDRMQLQVEVSQLVDELDRITSHAQFNAVNLFTGKFARNHFQTDVIYGSMWFHVGANMDQRERLYLNTMGSKAFGLRKIRSGEIISFSNPDNSNAAIGTIDIALSSLSKQRADLGTYQNRLEFTTKGIMVNSENTLNAETRIRSADMAKEMIEYVKGNILRDTTSAIMSKIHNVQREVVKEIVL